MKKPLFFPGLGETKDQYTNIEHIVDIAEIDWNTGETTDDTGYDTIISFSLGCVFALDIATQRPLEQLILCSPTPFETLEHNAKEVYFVIGDTETFLIDIFRPLYENRDNVNLILVKEGEHRFDEKYVQIVKNLITG